MKTVESYRGKTDYMAVIDCEESLQALLPEFLEIAKLDARGLRADCMAESNGCNCYNLQKSKKITQVGDLFSCIKIVF